MNGIRFYDLRLINKKPLISPDNQYITNISCIPTFMVVYFVLFAACLTV